MLVSISDLHFQDIDCDLKDKNGKPVIDHNVSWKAFRNFFKRIAEEYYANYKGLGPDAEIIILLNGDIFDFLRTERWFKHGDKVRPYDNYGDKPNQWDVDAGSNKIMNEIFKSITTIENGGITVNSGKSLSYFKAFLSHKGRTKKFKDGGLGIDEDTSKFLDGKNSKGKNKVRYEFVPGNHDKYINIYPDLNKKFREFFQIAPQSDKAKAFPWELPFKRYKTLARHGHIYDWFNSENNFTFRRKSAKTLNNKLFLNACVGDWITTDIISRIAYEYRNRMNLDKKPTKDNLFTYKKLKEMDDLRPMTAAMGWFLSEIGLNPMEDIKKSIQSALNSAFNKGAQKAFINNWDKAHDRRFWPDRSDIIQVIKPGGKLFLKVPDMIMNKIMGSMNNEENNDSVVKQIFEHDGDKFLDNDDYNYLLSGHVHIYSNNFLSKRSNGSEKIYVCTGTWRKKHFYCYDKSGFNSLKSMNYASIYNEDEVRLNDKKSNRRISIWNGLLGSFDGV